MIRLVIVICGVALTLSYSSIVIAADDDDDEAIEEVIVTGSYIRRDNFDLPSPKTTLDQTDIQMSGNTELGDIIFDQSFQLGVNANAAPFEGICCGIESSDGLGNSGGWGDNADNQQGNQGTEVWANLRGLGTRATMTMMDRHRLPADTTSRGERAGVDISGMYPAIAIGQVETILDGASALYGAEAVSGVINMIPRKDFEGLEFSYDYSVPLEDGAPNQAVSMLAGVQGDRGQAIFALELRDTDRMRFTDRPEFIIDTKNPWSRDASTGNRFYPRSQWSRFWKDMYNVGGNPASRFRTQIRGPDGVLMTQAERAAAGGDGLGRNTAQRGDVLWADNIANLSGDLLAGSRVKDPACGYAFASGHSDSGPEPSAGGPFWGADVGGWPNYEDITGPKEQAKWEAQFGPTHGRGFKNTYGETFIYNDITKHGNFMNGYLDPNDPSMHCRQVDSDYQDMQAEAERRKGFGYFEYELSDAITIRGEVVASQADYNTRSYAPSFNDFTNDSGYITDDMGIVVGSNPGNPFRAFADGSSWLGWDVSQNNIHEFPGTMVGPPDDRPGRWLPEGAQLDFEDVNGNGRYEYLVEPGEKLVFAQDLNGDGIPDRDFDGDGVADVNMQRDPTARVLLMGMEDTDGDGLEDRFDPDAGGIPLYNDVRFSNGVLFAFPKNPRNNNIPWIHDDGIASWLRETKRQDLRLRFGAEIRIPDTDWIIDADWIWARGVRETNQPQEITSALLKAFRCQGGPNNNSCWNPFGTTYLAMDENGFMIGNPDVKFPAADDPGYTPPDSEHVNTEEENRLAGLVMQYNVQDLGMTIVDVIASNSDLFNLWYNDEPVGFAIGTHWREERDEFRPFSSSQAALGGGKTALRKNEQESRAVFAEVSLPLLQHDTFGEMEMQLALRYTEIEGTGIIGQPGTSNFDTLIPKIAVRYSPTDWLAVRASKTEGFVTPGLLALFGEQSLTNIVTVTDYICDIMPDLQQCIDVGASVSGGVPGVRTANAGNSGLDAETSELYNVGFSLKLLDGDLVFDVDYTDIEFVGSVETIDANGHVAINGNGFQAFVAGKCPNTLLNWDNALVQPDADINTLTPVEFRASEYTSEADLACRAAAAQEWILTGANGGTGELPFGGSALERGRDGAPLMLTYVEEPWTAQGERITETVIYGVRYRFDMPDTRWTNWMGDGSFLFTMSATQFLTQSVQKFRSFGCDDDTKNSGGFCPNDHVFAGITVDGVGNRNSQYFSPPGMELYSVLPPTPEWRVNASLRWFSGPHTAQLSVRWHDSVTNINAAWDEMREREAADPRQVIPQWTWDSYQDSAFLDGNGTHGYPHFVPFAKLDDIPESERCAYQPWPVCSLASRAYWDLAYSYRGLNIFGAEATINVAIRNIFDEFPQAITQFSGHEPYLDNIMGRTAMVRINIGL